MTITQRVAALRQKMAKRNLEAYIVPTSDPHQSEYVAEYYKTREYISGFTGSAGTAVITPNACGLWTDGRYFLQAEEELKDTPFRLYRMGTEDPSVEEFLRENVTPFGRIGFDGKCMALETYRKMGRDLGRRMLITDVDFISEIWADRPALPGKPAFCYSAEYAGQTVEEKLEVLRYMLRDREVDCTFIGAPEDVCYLYNIRGWDVECTPVFLSYALVSAEQAVLFGDLARLPEEVCTSLAQAGVEVRAYEEAGEALAAIEGQKIVYLDPSRTNVSLFQKLATNVKVQQGVNLTTLMKAIKNDCEIENSKEAYIKDGVALVKFFNWVETGVSTGSITERNACEKLHALRQEQEDFLEDSFSAIIGYASNAAIVHYNPMHQAKSTRIDAKHMLLVDSGGHYLQGTTDITRTVAMGKMNEAEMRDYTLVLKAHIAGMTAKFPKGTKGAVIDAITRAPLRRECCDYNHGTGHGVGHVLSVHEGPQRFSAADNGVEIVPGMVTSMEPGLYVAGRHGIRIESITVCIAVEENQFGTFYALEPLTWVPIDTRPVMRDLLDAWEIDWLNSYNHTCYEKLSPHLEGEELDYLTERCKPLA